MKEWIMLIWIFMIAICFTGIPAMIINNIMEDWEYEERDLYEYQDEDGFTCNRVEDMENEE